MKSTAPKQFFVLRELRSSELGWFAAVRRQGREKGKQRGINFNSVVMGALFPEGVPSESIPVKARRQSDGEVTQRHLRLQQKNWRLVGDQVDGARLESVKEGDYFWALVTITPGASVEMSWDVACRSEVPGVHSALQRLSASVLPQGMDVWPAIHPLAMQFMEAVGISIGAAPEYDAGTKAQEGQGVPEAADAPLDEPPASEEAERPKRRRLKERLAQPHILTQILKTGLALTSDAQADFLGVLERIADNLRETLVKAGKIRTVPLGQRQAWRRFSGHKIGFIDGGMANVSALGSAPLAIRVGAYAVTPGERSPERERFAFDIQLVDELYDSAGPGVYEEGFDDVTKLRDAARICCEAAGMLAMLEREAPSLCVLHGPLVNPVSPYALEDFPAFSRATLAKLLPRQKGRLAPDDAHFVSVYLEQLRRLEHSSASVCGVVERPSSGAPGILTTALLEELRQAGFYDSSTLQELRKHLQSYRITDPILMECVLEEAEYLEPLPLDKQGPDNKIPLTWMEVIKSYPRPWVTYVKSHAETMPVRVEAFQGGPFSFLELMVLIVHMSRLLPRYSFPVGLDIVDKHAKVPEWMSRQVNVMLTAQLMRRAMDTKNPAVIRMARRIVSANKRDWLFRPDFRRS
jgi:hypothetical protein